jgi:hypothetical protein
MMRRGGAVLLLVLCSFLAVALTGCTSARDTLGTNASPCFEALAVGEDAVHARGTFAGVHLISLTSFGKDAHMVSILSARAGSKVHDVCVVSYRGTFRVDQVKSALGPPPAGGVGHYAIVIVSKPQNRLLGTVVRLTQPLRFGHPV